MADDLKDEIKLSVDASGVETGIGSAKRAIDSLGNTVDKAGKRSGDGLKQIGKAASESGQQVDRTTRNLVNSIQRQIAAAEAGGTATRAYQESIARLRGANMDVLKPYLDQLDAAKSKTDEAKRAAEQMTNAAKSMGSVLGGLAGGLLAGFSLRKFIDETVAAEQEQAQLVAVLKSTGEAAGWSRDQLNLMAEDLSRNSTYSTGEIVRGITRLSAYTGIVGKEYPRAMQIVIDQSARLGMSVEQSAEQIGRALDIPSQGFASLSRQGFRFAEGTKEQLEALEAVGKTAEAQAYLMEALESSYGGAAKAARDTFGGALSDLRKEISNLLTGGDGSISALRSGVELLTESVRDANAIFSAASGAANDLAGGISAATVVSEGLAIVFETVAALGVNVAFVLSGVGREIGGIAAQAAQLLQLNFEGAAAIRREMVADAEAARKQVDETTARILNARQNLRKELSKPIEIGDPSPTQTPVVGGAKAAEKAAKDAAKAAEQARKEFDALFSSLTNKEIGLDAKFNDQLKILYDGFQKGRISVDEYRAAVATLINQQPFVKAAIVEEAKATRERVKAWEADVKAQEAALKARQSATRAVEDSLQKARDEERAHSLAAASGITLAEAVERLALARAEENYQKEVGAGADGATLLALQQEIEARKGLVSVMQDRGVREANAKAADEAAKKWEQVSQTIGDTLADYIMAGGRDAASYLKRLFSTLVLRPVVETVVGGALNAVGFGGNSGILGAANNASSVYSFLSGGYKDTLSSISNFFGLGSSGVAGYAGTTFTPALSSAVGGAGWLSGSTTGFGSFSSASAATSFGGGSSAGLGAAGTAAAVIAAPLLVGLIAGMLDKGNRYSGAAYATSGGNDPLAQVISGAINLDGATGNLPDRDAILDRLITNFGAPDSVRDLNDRQLTQVLDRMGGVSAPSGYDVDSLDELMARYNMGYSHSGINWRSVMEGTEGSVDFYRGAGYADPNQLGWWGDSGIHDPAITAASRAIAESIVNPLTAISRIIGDESDFRVTTGMRWREDGTTHGGLEISRDGQELVNWGSQEFDNQADYLRATFSEALGVFESFDLPNWAQTTVEETQAAMAQLSGENLGQEAAALYEQASQGIAVTMTAIERLIKIVPELGGASQDAVFNIGQALGGLEQFTSLYSGFVQNFYSEAERFKYIRDGINDTLAQFDLSVTADTTRDMFREMVEAQDLATESGQQAFAALLQVSAAFAEITPVAEAAADSLSDLELQIQQIGESIGSDLTGVLADGLLGNLTGADLGGAMADVVIGGVYNALASNVGQQISDMMMSTVVTPLITAAMTGSSIAESVSQAAISNMVASAQAAAQALNAVLSSPEFQEALSGIDAAFKSITVSMPRTPYYTSYASQQQSRAAQQQKSATDSLKAAADALKASQDAAYSALQRAIDAEKKRVQTALDAALSLEREAGSLFGLLRDHVRDLYGEVDGAAAMQADQGRQFVQSALDAFRATGILPEQDALADAVDAIRGQMDAGQYASQFEYDFARLALAGQLDVLRGGAEAQLSEAEQQVALLEEQLASLDSTLDVAKDQLDALRGIDASILSVSDALANWTSAITSVVAPTAQAVSAVAGVVAGQSNFQISWTPVSPMKSYAVGTSYVPYDMTANIHKGERIITAADNQVLMNILRQGSGNGNAAVVAEIKALREDNRALGGQVVRLQNKIANILERWDGDGIPEEREEVTA